MWLNLKIKEGIFLQNFWNLKCVNIPHFICTANQANNDHCLSTGHTWSHPKRSRNKLSIQCSLIWYVWKHIISHIISVRNVITDLKTTTYTFKQRRRLILFKTEDDILIEVYKTSKCYVPAFMCRRFSNGYPNFNFDYYHYILEVRYILFYTEDDIYFLTQTTTFKLSLRWIVTLVEINGGYLIKENNKVY